MVYFINIAILFLLDGVLPKTEKKNKIIFCTIATLLWIFISGLRSNNVGADTERYQLMFQMTARKSWQEVLKNMKYYLSSGATKDPGYEILVKVIQLFTNDYQVFLIVVACMIFIPMGIWIYRYSEDPFISYLVFSGLFYSFFAITGIRQSIAMSFVVFIGYGLIKNKKFKSFILVVLIAASIHKGALIALLYLLIAKYPKERLNLYILFAVLLTIFLFIFRSSYTSWAASLLDFENYAIQQEGATPYTFTLLYVALIVFVMMFYRSIIEDFPSSSFYIISILTGLLCLPMVYVNQSAMRVVQMFSIYMMLFIPQLIEKAIVKDDQLLVKIILTVLIIILLVTNNPSYEFFWMA